MKTLRVLIKRNCKLFFRDKGMFFTALVTPGILLVLYATFLGNVYRDSFTVSLPPMFTLSDSILNGLVGGQLVSSILAVSCVTVAFCSNMLMIQDRANGTVKDLRISPVRSSTLAMGYYVATLISTLLICLAAAGVCLVYLAVIGWYLSALDVVLLLADVVLLTFFGTALSSVVGFFLSTQGQISAVGTIVSAGYGFICGAYMPLSQFSEGLQNAVAFLPGTYGTSLLRNHALNGVFAAMESEGVPTEVIRGMQDTVDCNLYVFDTAVEQSMMYLILGGSVALLVVVYVLLNALKAKKHKI